MQDRNEKFTDSEDSDINQQPIAKTPSFAHQPKNTDPSLEDSLFASLNEEKPAVLDSTWQMKLYFMPRFELEDSKFSNLCKSDYRIFDSYLIVKNITKQGGYTLYYVDNEGNRKVILEISKHSHTELFNKLEEIPYQNRNTISNVDYISYKIKPAEIKNLLNVAVKNKKERPVKKDDEKAYRVTKFQNMTLLKNQVELEKGKFGFKRVSKINEADPVDLEGYQSLYILTDDQQLYYFNDSKKKLEKIISFNHDGKIKPFTDKLMSCQQARLLSQRKLGSRIITLDPSFRWDDKSGSNQLSQGTNKQNAGTILAPDQPSQVKR